MIDAYMIARFRHCYQPHMWCMWVSEGGAGRCRMHCNSSLYVWSGRFSNPTKRRIVPDLLFVMYRAECTPEDAVFCDDGLSCQSGTAGYTCGEFLRAVVVGPVVHAGWWAHPYQFPSFGELSRLLAVRQHAVRQHHRTMKTGCLFR